MVEVRKIKTVSPTLSKIQLKICKEAGVQHLIPSTPAKILSFELHNTIPEFANMIRVFINSRLNVFSLTFKNTDIKTDDDFIILDKLRKSIQLIPIKQIKSLSFQLNVVNTTDKIMPIYSSDLIQKNGNKKEKYMSQTICIEKLKPGKSLSIKKIEPEIGNSYLNGARFSYPGKVMYEVIGDIKESCMVKDPTSYKLTLGQQRFIDPKIMVRQSIIEIKKSLSNLKNFTNNKLFSVKYHTKSSATIKLINETVQLCNCVCKYIYKLDPTIEYIAAENPHVEYNYSHIKIKHSNIQSIVKKAVIILEKDLDKVCSAFK